VNPFLSLSIETPQYVDIHAGTSADLYIMYHNGDKPKDYFVVLNSWSDCAHLCYHFQNLCIKLDVANGHITMCMCVPSCQLLCKIN